MKDLFPQFYRPTSEAFKRLWKEAIFVPDANLLLNIYRYPEDARKSLLNTLKRISSRIWVPHMVALEFQRNRLKVVTQSLKPVKDLSGKVAEIESKLGQIKIQIQDNQKRGILGDIDTKKFEKNTTKALVELKNSLGELEKNQVALFDQDTIGEEVVTLLRGKIGPPPKTQKELNAIYEEGEERFKNEIPPGYADQPKENESQVFVSGGLQFQRKYGDLLLWKQIIKYAKDNKKKRIIFITDDRKEDWWWKEKCNGEKTIGPRPELIEEIKREGEVDLFYMYSPEQFLKYAQGEFQLKLEPASLDQIKEIAALREAESQIRLFGLGSETVDAVFAWVQNRYQFHEWYEVSPGEIDFGIRTLEDKNIGFKVAEIKHTRPTYITSFSGRASLYKESDKFDEIYAVIVLRGVNFEERIFKNPANLLLDEGWNGVYFGSLDYRTDNPNLPYFRLHAEMSRENW